MPTNTNNILKKYVNIMSPAKVGDLCESKFTASKDHRISLSLLCQDLLLPFWSEGASDINKCKQTNIRANLNKYTLIHTNTNKLSKDHRISLRNKLYIKQSKCEVRLSHFVEFSKAPLHWHIAVLYFFVNWVVKKDKIQMIIKEIQISMTEIIKLGN